MKLSSSADERKLFQGIPQQRQRGGEHGEKLEAYGKQLNKWVFLEEANTESGEGADAPR